MKAEDLMIGDYLRVNRDGICIPKGTIVRVFEIDSENTFREKGLKGSARCETMDDTWLSGGIWCDYLDPIPLTPEILEKNGFIKVNTQRYDLGDPECIYININPKKGIIHINGENRSNCNLYGEFYVHQLQHALRLCGISKDITL